MMTSFSVSYSLVAVDSAITHDQIHVQNFRMVLAQLQMCVDSHLTLIEKRGRTIERRRYFGFNTPPSGRNRLSPLLTCEKIADCL